MEFLIFKCFLKSKHKIYILSKNVLIRICRPHSGKLFPIPTFFSYLVFCSKIEFLNFDIFLELKQKIQYIFYEKLCQTKFVHIIEANNFAFLRFFRTSHIMVKKLNFQ